jgi:hypothetical protein
MPNNFEELRSPLIFVSIFYDGHKLYTGAKLVMADARKSKLYVIISGETNFQVTTITILEISRNTLLNLRYALL